MTGKNKNCREKQNRLAGKNKTGWPGVPGSKSKVLLKASLTLLAAVILLLGISACSGMMFVPGASTGYFIWEDKNSNIHVAWSADRKETGFDGKIATDGVIAEHALIGFEDEDTFNINESKDSMGFNASLSEDDFSDELVFKPESYSYIEFDLKINDAYDLSRTNVGAFLNNPEQGVFRISEDYFDEVSDTPIYARHPYSGFLYKLARDMRFTVFYLFVFGAIAIELIRITVLRRNKKYNWYLFLCYGILFLIIFIVYLLLNGIS